MAHNVTIQSHTNKVEAPLEIIGKNLHSVNLALSLIAFFSSKTSQANLFIRKSYKMMLNY